MGLNPRRVALLIIDTIIFFAIYFISLFIVVGFDISKIAIDYWLWLALPLEVILKTSLNTLFGIYKRLYKYRGRRDLLYLAIVSTATNLVVFTVFGVLWLNNIRPLKLSALFVAAMIEVIYLLFSRMFIAYYIETLNRKEISANTDVTKRTIIIGAGSAGQILFNESLHNRSLGYDVVAFVDDDEAKIGMVYCGKKIYGPISTINDIKLKLNASVVIIAIPSANKETITKISKLIDYKNTEVLVMPDFARVLSGEISPTLKKLSIEDLLGRNSIKLDLTPVKKFYENKVVLITGGGGSIGSEIARQVSAMNPKKLILLDIYENCAYDIQQELKMKYKSDLDLQVEIVSITNRPALDRVFAMHKPNIVIMAAAHKHVPLMEHNVIEAVENNVFGTLNTVELAEKYGCDRVHMVSTDKAVNPTSIMGATKRICEMICQAHSTIAQHTTFSITRFGNVLGSAGSVIPLFRRQIENGGPITLTDYRIIRYFMTIPEASQLVLTSSSMAMNGELFVLDMGSPVKIYDLAVNMIKMSGLEPNKDIEIIETGLRPGEKLYEELLVKTEELDKTDNELIFIERDKPLSLDEIKINLDKLCEGIIIGDDNYMKEIIKSVVPTFIEKEQANKKIEGEEVK